MRRAAPWAGSILAVAMSGQAWAAGGQGCDLSRKEALLVRATTDRMVTRASSNDLGVDESRLPSLGCGVWSIVIGRDGAVVSTRFLRGRHRGAFVDVVEPWLRENRYQPSERQWNGLALVVLNPKDDE